MDEFDEDRLRASAPWAGAPLGLAEHRQRIMSEVRGRHRTVSRIWTGAAIATAALVGAGSVAVAGNGTETPWGWSADAVYSIPGPNGQTCFAGIRVMPDGVAADSEAMLQAREIVAAIDLDSLDTSAYEQEMAAEIGTPFDDGAEGTVFYTPQEIKQSAVHSMVAEILFDELARRGLSIPTENGPVSLSSDAMGCQ